MKKSASLLFAVITVLALTGCSGKDTQSTNDGGNGADASSAKPGYPDEDGYAEGGLNDTMHSYFFDFTVKSAYLCDSYGDYVPEDGYEFLVADMTVKNTTSRSITMYDTDFQVQWNDDSDDAFDVPLTYYLTTSENIGAEVYPAEYDLKAKESRDGILVFTVPTGYDTDYFAICYEELFEDDTKGDIFFVYFVPERK